MAINFNEMLNTPQGKVERPPLIPQGVYLARVIKVPSFDTVGQNDQWDTVDFAMQLMAPHEGVDEDELKAYGGLTKASVRSKRFMFNREDEAAIKKTAFQLKNFCIEHLKIEATDDTPLKELLNNAFNTECLVFIKWRADKQDPEIQFDEIGKTAPV